MYLKHLDVHGFKTFANRTNFIFDHGVTAVVGPNGSGKSNVADAVRWVMGEQSFSELRVKKTEDLIFTGSATRPRLGMAEVSLTFENPDSFADLPVATPTESDQRADAIGELLRANPSEVTIGRRAYRDGQNEYYLNGTRVRLRDILELLARWGLARNTYAVIGQGLVDQALSLRPEERRALFEEAAGIGLYQSKRQNALNKLAETQQNLLRVNDIINELAPRLPSLARQAERARNYDGVVASLDDRLRTWYAYQWHRAQGAIQEMALREKNTREILNTRRGEVQTNTARLVQLRRQSQELRAQLAESRRARAARESEHANRTRELAVIEERLRFTTQQRDEAASELRALDASQRAHATRIERANANRQSKEAERNALAERVNQSEKSLRDLEYRAAHAETLLEESEPQIRQLAQKLAQLKAELGVYEQGLREASALSAQADALNSIEFKRAQAATAVETARANLAELRAALTIAERDVAGARGAEESARRDLAQIEAQRATKARRVESANQQVADLTAQRDQLKARADETARALAEIDARVAPVDASLADAEKAQQELEEQESLMRARLAEFEDAHNRAVLDVERARAEIARLETEVEDDLASGRIVSEIKMVDDVDGAMRETSIVLDTDLPQQLRLQLGEEVVALPVVTSVPEGLEKEIRKFRNQLKYMGTVNPNAPQEYDELKARHTFLTEQAADAAHAIESLNKAVAELDEIMRQRFSETFKAIGVEFTKYFTLLFNGGTARLELTDPENITQTGIDIVARPPGKRAAHLAMLSGGERSLTAAALLFAILKVSPTPFCVLDEVDAALDEANVGRFRDVLRTLAAQTQFIVITHNRTTIESANAVYGITMSEDGVSQAISLRLDVNGNGSNGTRTSADERG
ncbi:MAG: chromosome segregation protein SMC [Chloroflexi bacterium]|nr:chromosome segregation protein SMC [Chloroflexota bacterium]